ARTSPAVMAPGPWTRSGARRMSPSHVALKRAVLGLRYFRLLPPLTRKLWGSGQGISDVTCPAFTPNTSLPYGAGFVMVLVSNVTAAVRANALPSTVAPVVTVMEAKAR